MSDEQATPPQIIDVTPVPASEVKPEDVATLSLRYVDGVPVLVVSGGNAVQASLAVVNESGEPIAAYTAGPAANATARGSAVCQIPAADLVPGDVVYVR